VKTLASFLAPLIYNNLFAFFISEEAPMQIPSICFFLDCLMLIVALAVAGYLFLTIPPSDPREDLLVNESLPTEKQPLLSDQIE
jgi:hypothetical protein